MKEEKNGEDEKEDWKGIKRIDEVEEGRKVVKERGRKRMKGKIKNGKKNGEEFEREDGKGIKQGKIKNRKEEKLWEKEKEDKREK